MNKEDKNLRRKPISLDTTLRNPRRIPEFISILNEFNGKVIDDKLALELEARIYIEKIVQPSVNSLGTYRRDYSGKFKFKAEDQSNIAPNKVRGFYEEWKRSKPGEFPLEKMVYLLKNTLTDHKEKGWDGGWQSRIKTQFSFSNELGLVQVFKNKKIRISDNGKLMIHEYKNGHPKDNYDETFEESSFLIAFAKYQTNNPFRSNVVKINLFPLILNVISYLQNNYGKSSISKQDLPFIITWINNDYKSLSEMIMKFRDKFGYNTSDELVYQYAMNFLDDDSDIEMAPASSSFIISKKRDYKFSKIINETPDEIIRKLRLTMLISFKGPSQFIGINSLELDKINHVIDSYSKNVEFTDDVDSYFEYMGKIDKNLLFKSEQVESQSVLSTKEKTILDWSKRSKWEYLKQEMLICTNKSKKSKDPILKYVKETARLEFLTAIVLKKALPKVKIIANYKADDSGIPFSTASGSGTRNIGADIDIFENDTHALAEPTISKTRSFQTDHELNSIEYHLVTAAKKDVENKTTYKNWFALFIAPKISEGVGNATATKAELSRAHIYSWEIRDFVDFSKKVNSINDYTLVRPYAKPLKMPN